MHVWNVSYHKISFFFHFYSIIVYIAQSLSECARRAIKCLRTSTSPDCFEEPYCLFRTTMVVSRTNVRSTPRGRGGRGGRGRGRGRNEGGRSQGIGRGQSRGPDKGKAARDQAAQGRGRGRGMSSTSTGRKSKRAAAAAASTTTNDVRKVPQHQLMIQQKTKEKSTKRKKKCTSQAIVQVPASDEIPTSQAIVQVPASDEIPTSQAIVLAPIRDSRALEVIMNNVVADTSRDQYNTRAVGFVLWCYEQHTSLVDSELVEKLNAVEGIMKQRLAVKVAMKELNRHDINSCPIKLKKLTFQIFSEYLLSLKPKKKKKKRRRKQKRIGGRDGSASDNEESEEEDTTAECNSGMYLSKSSYGSARSALMHLYRGCGAVMEEAFKTDLANFMRGIKRKVAKQKQDMGTKADEGKSPMSFQVYEKLCELMMESEDDEFIFGHCFLTLEWNLMARSDNVVHSHVNHLEWRDDCLLYYILRSKGDQEGSLSSDPWHVYANPMKPDICPILALGKYLLANPQVTEGTKLFSSTDPYQRFSKVLRKCLEDNEAAFNDLGIDIDDIGTHSARKGAATHCSTGSTVSPPMASICLRAGWSMGPVKEKYIHYEKAGDQYVGRVVTGLNVNSVEFAVSPPYFNFPEANGTDGGGTGIATIEEDIKHSISSLILGGRNMSPQTFSLLTFCYASICYHYDYLDDKLHSRSRVRQSPLYQQCKDEWKAIAVVDYPWSAKKKTPSLTGIPPHILLLSKLQIISENIENFKDDFKEVLVSELDAREIGSNNFAAQRVIDELTITRNQLRDMIQDQGRRPTIVPTRGTTGGRRTTIARPQGPGWHVYGGGFHMLPKDWRIPSMTFVQFISMWLCGDIDNGVPPLSKVTTYHWKGHATQHRRVAADMKYIMGHVKRSAESRKTWNPPSHEWTVQETLRTYESVKALFMYKGRNGTVRSRFQEFSWRTVVNLVRNNKGNLIGEEVDIETNNVPALEETNDDNDEFHDCAGV